MKGLLWKVRKTIDSIFVLADADTLKEDFLGWIHEYDMDYAREQWDSDEEFERFIHSECEKFIKKWRSNVAKKYLVNEGTEE